MTKTVSEFEHESLQDSETIGKYFEALQQGFRRGHLQFASGGKELVLHPQELLEFMVKAKRKNGRVKITIEVAWKERARPERAPAPLRIHTPKAAKGR